MVPTVIYELKSVSKSGLSETAFGCTRGAVRQGDSFILSHIYQLREMSCYMEGLLEGLLHGLVSCGWFKGATSQGQCTTSLPLFI